MKKITLILGGARSGKSTYAQQLAREAGKPVVYIATARAEDDEMVERISAHRQERSVDWLTLEAPEKVGEAICQFPHPPGVVLLDCMTLLTSNILISLPEDVGAKKAEAMVFSEVQAIRRAFENLDDEWIIVSNEVGLGIVPAYPLGRLYRDVLGRANQVLAEFADQVFFLVAGIPMRVK